MTDNTTTLLGLDLGTTHIKVGLFSLDGQVLYLASRSSPVERSRPDYAFYDPESIWWSVSTLLAEVEGWRLAQGWALAASGSPGCCQHG